MAAVPVCSRIGDKVEIDVAVNFEEQLEQLELTVILGFLAYSFVSSCITKGIARSCKCLIIKVGSFGII